MKQKLLRFASRWGPWILAVVVIVALARKYDPVEVATQLRQGAWHLAAPFGFVLPFCYLGLHGLADTAIFSRTLGRVRYVDLIRARSGTAVLMLAGYFFGHAAFGLWIARKTGARASAVSATVLYGMGSDLASVGVVVCVALALGRPEVPRAIHTTAFLVTAIPLALALAGPLLLAKTKSPVLAPWRTIRPHVAAVQMVGRALDVGLAVVLCFGASRAFGLTIPFAVFAAYMPVILLVSSLPVSVGGFGAAQLAWLVFLPWASGEKILAFQLVWQLGMGAGLLARGLPFARAVVRDIREGAALPKKEEAEKEESVEVRG